MATKTATKKKATAKKAPAKRKATKKTVAKKATPAKKAAGKPTAPAQKLSAIAAAAKVLGESKEPMNAKQMIEAMATKGYWTSPGGKTPDLTLYAAIHREIKTKGKDARFVKVDRGHFTLRG